MLCAVVHIGKPITGEVVAGNQESKASLTLDHMRPCFLKKNQKEMK